MGAFLVITGLALGLATLASVSSTNRMNMRMQEQINEQQKELFNEANEFNRQERIETQEFNAQQVREERAYNSPMMQAQRLLNAGLNPGAILGGDAAKTLGAATSSPASSASIPNLQAPVSQPTDFSGLTKPFYDYAAYDQMATETQIRKEDLQFKGIDQMLNLSERISKIDNTLADTNLKEDERSKLQADRRNLNVVYKSLLLQYNRDYQASQFDYDNNKAIRDINVANALKASQDQQHQDFMNKLEEQWAPKMKEQEYRALKKSIQKMDAEIAELGTRSDMNVAQKEKLIEEKFETIARKNGLEFDNNLRNDCKTYLQSQIRLETELMENNVEKSYWDSYNSYLDANYPIKALRPNNPVRFDYRPGHASQSRRTMN